jgi:hypothetical protein
MWWHWKKNQYTDQRLRPTKPTNYNRSTPFPDYTGTQIFISQETAPEPETI